MSDEPASDDRALSAPPIATDDGGAVEVLRVWAAPDGPTQVTLRTNWDDPAHWGVLLIDIARHAALAYAREGQDPNEALDRIQRLWSAEIVSPTGSPEDITPDH